MTAAAGPQVGQTVQFIEAPGATPQAAIVVAVQPGNRADLAVWNNICVEWTPFTSIPPFNPNTFGPGWREIATV